MRGQLFLLTLAEYEGWKAEGTPHGRWLIVECVAREGYVEADLLHVPHPYVVTSCALFATTPQQSARWMSLGVQTTRCKPYSRVELSLTWLGMDTLKLPGYRELVERSVTQADMDNTRVELEQRMELLRP